MLSWSSLPRAGALLLACTVVLSAATPPYRDRAVPLEQRVEDLLARMTPQEKLAQLVGHALPTPKAGQSVAALVTPEWLRQNLGAGIGTIGPSMLAIADEAAVRNRVREFLARETRLGIPVLFHDELCHGLMKPEATSFPAPIGLAGSWNEELIERLLALAAREARSRGTHQALTPIVDVTLDPRWGRTEETLGEDPYLNGRLGAAMVRGLQGSATGEIAPGHVMATLKHFVGHGASEGGLNRSPAHVGPIELRTTHLAPFADAIRLARPAAVMPSYNEVDGIPSHANAALLLGVLRGEWGFTGLIVSDYDAVGHLHEDHHVTADAAGSARLTLESGVQLELPKPETFPVLEPELAKDPALRALVDDAVRAMLRWKFRLGLFEEGPIDAAKALALAQAPESRELALQAARESIVLLKNDGGLLPLRPGAHRRIAVIGPNADIARLGGYSGTPFQTVSLLDGIRARVAGVAEVVHAEGCKIANQDARDSQVNWRNIIDVKEADPAVDQRLIAEAVQVAQGADLVVLALGETEVVSRESWGKRKLGDRAALELIGAQTELAERILALGKPVVLYLMNGRPISLGSLAERVPAILEGWYAGQETGRAAAEILFGDVNPSAKLTISVPRSAGHLPAHYRRKPYSAPYTYLFTTHEPLYPFGYGLSYTTYAYANIRVEEVGGTGDAGGATGRGRPVPSLSGGDSGVGRGEGGPRFRVTVDVTNTGARAGVEIAQLYLRDEISRVTRPVRELRGFARVPLAPGETRAVSFELGPDALATWTPELKQVIEPGWFTVWVGGSSQATLSARFEVK